MIKKLFIVFCIPFTLISQSFAMQQSAETQNFAEGQVYEDVNKNGEKDSEEAGIAGVAVSNQRDVVLTDDEGHYRLPASEEMIVFITKPADYELPVDENNLPQFYYIHQPQGSPELKYAGVEPTGPLPESLDFGLIPSQKKMKFKALIFGDPQPRNNTELSYFRDDVVPELANTRADLTLVLGDIMFNDLSLYERYNQIMKTVGGPVFNVIGNHDINFDAEETRYNQETFKRVYGPAYYSFEHGDVHFIILDNVDYDSDREVAYRGFLEEVQLEWLSQDLEHVADDKLIVISSHIPIYSDNGKAQKRNLVNRDKLVEMLEDRDHVLFLSAHRHRLFHDILDEEIGRENPNPIHQIITAVASGSWWNGRKNQYGIPVATQKDGVPNGYHIFKFDGNTYSEQYKGAGHDSGYQMRIEQPESSVTIEELGVTELLVNVFNGNEKSEVQFQVNNRDGWIDMKRQEKSYSPFFEKTMSDYLNVGHTNHIWTADLPDLEKGIHKITVRTRDMYGQKFSQSKIIEVKELSTTETR